jgi:RRXRR protein/HNH endonuclease
VPLYLHCRGERIERFRYKARKGIFYGEIMAVFVLGKDKKPLMPCSEKRARLLLDRGRARIHSMHPFTIRLVDRTAKESTLQPVRCKIDPGSTTTGIAIVREEKDEKNQVVLFLMELIHRGNVIRKSLQARASFRRRRRGNLRYRPKRFSNRSRPKGWLPPSLLHRVQSVLTWVKRLCKLTPLTAITCEIVRFDIQKLLNPEIDGVEYTQGTLFGYEVREYLFEKWGRKCVYCNRNNIPLQIDHIIPQSRGGSNRIDNLTIACACCNQKKGNLPVEVFSKKPIPSPPPLRGAAAVNSTRNALWGALLVLNLPCEQGTGGQTKYNRSRFGIPKTHALDAACTGVTNDLQNWNIPTHHIIASGRGSYQRTRSDCFGFPRGYLLKEKKVHGFQTGDHVIAQIPSGKKAGIYRGRCAVRSSGYFNIQTDNGVVQGISHEHCRIEQRADGYHYLQLVPAPHVERFNNQETKERRFLPRLKSKVSAPAIL